MRIGIDFGTTHTTAAYLQGNDLQLLPLDHANRDPHLLRSILYISREHEVQLGIPAVETYLQDNTGRLPHYVPKVVGTIENTVSRISRHPLEPDGPITFIHDVIIEEDVGAPGRLLQSIKSVLRDRNYVGTDIYDRFYKIEELIGLILEHVRCRAEQVLTRPVTEVMLGRPVKFSEDPATDALAEQRLVAAAKTAGFARVSLSPEPVAAAHFYTRGIQSAQTILVFDFGGGTLDLTVMRTPDARANGHQLTPQVLGTEGVLIGGDDFDSAIMRDHVSVELGVKGRIDAQGHPFPAHLAEKLYQWQTIPELSKTDALPVIRRAGREGSNPKAFAALENLVMKNYGFALFERIEQAKRRLSTAQATEIALQTPEFDLLTPLTRADFQHTIGAGLAQVQRGLDAVLREAGVGPDAIDVVVTTGGSSLIPILGRILHRRFPEAELVHSDTFGSVAAGLALQAR